MHQGTPCWGLNSPFDWSLRHPSFDRLRTMVYRQDTSQTPPVHRALCVRSSTSLQMTFMGGWAANVEDRTGGSSFAWREVNTWPAVLCGLIVKAHIRIR